MNVIVRGAQATGGKLPRVVNPLLRPLGVRLQALHPGIQDAELAEDYFVPVRDEAMAQRVIDLLLGEPAVDGAYLEPTSEAP